MVYKLKYNFLTWIILKCMKTIFNMTNPIGYIDGDAIALFHSGNMDYMHGIQIRKTIFKNTTKLVDTYIKEGKQYCIDYIMLEYL